MATPGPYRTQVVDPSRWRCCPRLGTPAWEGVISGGLKRPKENRRERSAAPEGGRERRTTHSNDATPSVTTGHRRAFCGRIALLGEQRRGSKLGVYNSLLLPREHGSMGKRTQTGKARAPGTEWPQPLKVTQSWPEWHAGQRRSVPSAHGCVPRGQVHSRGSGSPGK